MNEGEYQEIHKAIARVIGLPLTLINPHWPTGKNYWTRQQERMGLRERWPQLEMILADDGHVDHVRNGQ